MTPLDIAQALYAHCENHTEAQGLVELYAEDAVSIEPMAPEGGSPITEGRAAIQGKHDWWAENFEVHSVAMEGPFINGDNFAITFEIDCTEKASGNRWKAKEIGLYETAGGKIIRESFFMAPM